MSSLPIHDLSDFSRQLAHQLLHLVDADSKREVPLSPYELKQVAQELLTIAQGLIAQGEAHLSDDAQDHQGEWR